MHTVTIIYRGTMHSCSLRLYHNAPALKHNTLVSSLNHKVTNIPDTGDFTFIILDAVRGIIFVKRGFHLKHMYTLVTNYREPIVMLDMPEVPI